MNFLDLFKQGGLIGAHRGASAVAPENTMSAVKASIGKCDFVEVDVQLSSDGMAVIIHDDTLERTTDVARYPIFKERYPYKVSSFAFGELFVLDYGSWFYGKGSGVKKEPLLTLYDLLTFAKENGIYLNVEIKDIHEDFDDMQVVATVLSEIKQTGMEDQVLLSSFRHAYLPLCKKILPEVPTAALVERRHPKNLTEYLRDLQVDAYHLSAWLVKEKTVKLLRDEGFFVGVYTVNKAKRKEKLFAMGVNAIFTDVLE